MLVVNETGGVEQVGPTRADDVGCESEGEERCDPGGEGDGKHVAVMEDGTVVDDSNAASWRHKVRINKE
jgi:hypothetical protein